MDPKKVSAIMDWPSPCSVHDIQVFLGFANFYCHFVFKYSKIATPLTRLLRKGIPFHFDTSAQEAFLALKKAFTSAPVLAHFDPSRAIVVETDASDFAIAGVLSQVDDNKFLRPIAFYSRKLTDSELNYEIYNKEMLAIVTCIGEWCSYLEGSTLPFTVYADHKNLEYFLTTNVLNCCQARWSELLGGYDFTIVYRPGSAMGKPDAMSRCHDFSEGSRASQSPPTTLLKPGQLILAAINLSEEPHETLPSTSSDILPQLGTLQKQDPILTPLLPYLQDLDIPQPPDIQVDITGFSLVDDIVHFNSLIYVPVTMHSRLISYDKTMTPTLLAILDKPRPLI